MRMLLSVCLLALVSSQDPKPFSAELVARVKDRLLSIHPWYLDKALGEDVRRRVETLIAAGKGTAEDAAWLDSLSSGNALETSREEAAMAAQKIAGLEGGITDDLPVDKLVLTDGRTMDCRILEDNATEVKIERKLSGGVSGKMTFKKEQVKEIQKGKGAGAQFAGKLNAAKAVGAPGFVGLADWCKEQSLMRQREYALWMALKGDPGNAVAREALALGKTPDEKKAPKSGKTINFEGKDWDAAELKAKLIKDGNVLHNGQWYTKKDRMLTIPGLQRYEKQEKKQLLIGGEVPMVANFVMSYKSVYSAASQQYNEEKTKTYTHRFFAPEMTIETKEVKRDTGREKIVIWYEDEGNPKVGSAMSGEVRIPIAVEQPVFGARITAYAEIDQGSVTCSIDAAGNRTQVYSVSKKDSSTHDVPAFAVAGLRTFDIVFKIDTVAAYISKEETRKVAALKKSKDNAVLQAEIEVRHKKLTLDYKVRLFSSNSNQVEVFRATLSCGEPAPSLTKLFEDAGCGDLLK